MHRTYPMHCIAPMHSIAPMHRIHPMHRCTNMLCLRIRKYVNSIKGRWNAALLRLSYGPSLRPVVSTRYLVSFSVFLKEVVYVKGVYFRCFEKLLEKTENVALFKGEFKLAEALSLPP
jgi:hypothetical protein